MIYDIWCMNILNEIGKIMFIYIRVLISYINSFGIILFIYFFCIYRMYIYICKYVKINNKLI